VASDGLRCPAVAIKGELPQSQLYPNPKRSYSNTQPPESVSTRSNALSVPSTYYLFGDKGITPLKFSAHQTLMKLFVG
jgi:hypothetical protein